MNAPSSSSRSGRRRAPIGRVYEAARPRTSTTPGRPEHADARRRQDDRAGLVPDAQVNDVPLTAPRDQREDPERPESTSFAIDQPRAWRVPVADPVGAIARHDPSPLPRYPDTYQSRVTGAATQQFVGGMNVEPVVGNEAALIVGARIGHRLHLQIRGPREES